MKTRSLEKIERNHQPVSVLDSLVRAHVVLRGLPPGLLMGGKGIMEADAKKTGKAGAAHRTAEEEARLRAHWTKHNGKESLAIPWTNLYNCFCKGASLFKKLGGIRMDTAIATAISCEQEKIPLGTDQYEVYVEWCRIPPRTGAMVQIGRPRIREWRCELDMIIDGERFGTKLEETIRAVISESGKMVGLGPWRPQLKGPYGRFLLEEFRIIE